MVEWKNWYITCKNRFNHMSFGIEKHSEEAEKICSEDRHNWLIYITLNLEDKYHKYQSSSLESFNESEMFVTTRSGSTYYLKEPMNDDQLPLLRLYFSKDAHPDWDSNL